MSIKDWSTKGILALVAPILKDVAVDLVQIAASEVPALIAKVSFEASTPDGFTMDERKAFARARLDIVLGKEIGNKYTDKFFDFLIEASIKRWLKEKEDNKDVELPPLQPKDVYYQVLNEMPSDDVLVVGDKVYFRASDAKWFVTGRVGVGTPERYGFVLHHMVS